MKIRNLLVFSVIPLAFAACSKDNNNNNNSGVKGMNGTVVNNITYANLSEIDLGQLAVSKASNNSVKSFGQMMVSDHQTAQNELKPIASTRNFTLPTAANQDQQNLKTRISGYSGFSFDTAYIHSQQKAHTATQAMFMAFRDSTKDATLKAYVVKYLPVIQKHLHMADSLANV